MPVPDYHAKIELNCRYDESAIDDLTDVMDEYAGTVARAAYGGRAELSFPVSDNNPRRATITAMSVALTTGQDLYAVEVLPADEFHRRIDAVDLPELVSVPEAAELLKVTRQAVLNQVQSGKLPATKVGETWAIPRTAAVAAGEQIARRFEGLALPVGPVSSLGQVIDEDAIDAKATLPVYNERGQLIGVAAARRENDGWHVHGRLRQYTPGEYQVVPQIEYERVSYDGDLRRTTRGILNSVTVLGGDTDRESTFREARVTVSDRRTHLNLASLDLPTSVSRP